MWHNPYMGAASKTFINTILEKTGLVNVLSQKERYPEITPGQMASLNPSIVLLSSEPFPFREKHMAEIKAILPQAEVYLVDGEMFSWYGSRLILAPDYFRSLSLL